MLLKIVYYLAAVQAISPYVQESRLRADYLPCFSSDDCPIARKDFWTCNTSKNDIINPNVIRHPKFVPTIYTLREEGVLNLSPTIENYDLYVQKYLWAIVRAILSGEPIGQCELTSSNNSAELSDPSNLKEKKNKDPVERKQVKIEATLLEGSSKAHNWVIDVEPEITEQRSILNKSMLSNLNLFEPRIRDSGYILKNLGDISCIPVTKIGKYTKDSVAHFQDKGLNQKFPVPKSFHVNYRPLVKTKESPYISHSGPSGFVRYVAEPYELTVSSDLLDSVINRYHLDSKTTLYPAELALKRSTMKLLMSTIVEIVSIAEMYRDKNAPFHDLLEFVDGKILNPLSKILETIVIDNKPYIYFNFYESSQGVDIYNGMLPVVCDFVGDAVVTVEIFALLLDKQILDGLAFALGLSDTGNMSIQQFIDAVELSASAYNTCSARIICYDD